MHGKLVKLDMYNKIMTVKKKASILSKVDAIEIDKYYL